MPIQVRQPRGPRFPWNVILAFIGALLLLVAVWPRHAQDRSQGEVPPLMPVDSAPALGAPMVGPMPGQKTPPCKPRGRPGLPEVEAKGACWYVVEGKPPCGEGYDFDGRCHIPVPARFKVPNAVDEQR